MGFWCVVLSVRKKAVFERFSCEDDMTEASIAKKGRNKCTLEVLKHSTFNIPTR